jgi:hypothetical protein
MHSDRPRRLVYPVAAAVLALLVPPARATTLLQMDLAQLCTRADRIFRGTVLSARVGTIEAGGAQIPTVTYRIDVSESFKGEYQSIKGRRIADIRMIGKPATTASGSSQLFAVLRDVPHLKVGETYLLLTTPPSAAGLSTTVGLGQGRFRLTGKAGTEEAVNDFGNRGLFGAARLERTAAAAPTARIAAAGPSAEGGPVPYSMLAERIRAIVGAR